MDKIINVEMVEPDLKLWFDRATKVWGTNAQIDLMIEEMAELIVALEKHKRNIPLNNDNPSLRNKITINVAEEIADVTMMIVQMMVIFKNQSLVDAFLIQKYDRLKEKVINGEIEKEKNQNAIRLLTPKNEDG